MTINTITRILLIALPYTISTFAYGAAEKEFSLTRLRHEIKNIPEQERLERLGYNDYSLNRDITIKMEPALKYALYTVPRNVEALSLEATNALLNHISVDGVLKIIYGYWGNPDAPTTRSTEEDLIKAELLQFSSMNWLHSISQGIVYSRYCCSVPSSIDTLLPEDLEDQDERTQFYCFNAETNIAHPLPESAAKLYRETDWSNAFALNNMRAFITENSHGLRSVSVWPYKNFESVYTTALPYPLQSTWLSTEILVRDVNDQVITRKSHGSEEKITPKIDAMHIDNDNIATFQTKRSLYSVDLIPIR